MNALQQPLRTLLSWLAVASWFACLLLGNACTPRPKQYRTQRFKKVVIVKTPRRAPVATPPTGGRVGSTW